MSLHRFLVHGRNHANLAAFVRSISTCPTTSPSICQHYKSQDKCHLRSAWPSTNLLVVQGLRNADGLCNVMTKRFRRPWKVTRHAPTKEINFDFAGDETDKLPPFAKDDVRPGFEGLEDLIAQGGDEVKRMFSMEFANESEKMKKRTYNILNQVKEHPADAGSVEAQIAFYTVLIRTWMKHHHQYRKNMVMKTRLYILISRRRKMMKYLRRIDKEKADWLSKELKYKFIEIPEPQENRKLSKREVRKKQAEDAAEELRAEKYEVFREKLAEERQEFEIHKAKEMESILKEMEDLQIKPGPSLETALVALGDQPKRPARPLNRRKQTLQELFIQNAEGGPRQLRKAQRAALAAASGKK